MAVYELAHLLAPTNVTSGIGQYLWLAKVVDFDVDGIKGPEAPFAAPGDRAKIKTAHVFLATKGFAKYQLAPRTNKLDAKSIGDIGFAKSDITIEAFVQGSYAEVHEAMAELLNVPLIAMVKDAECTAGLYYQLGTDCVFAFIDWDFTTGTEVDGKKGYLVRVKCTASGIKLYTAAGGPEALEIGA